MTPQEMKDAMEALLHSRKVVHYYADGSGTFTDTEAGWDDDEEHGHANADEIMEQALRQLGYDEAMDIYAAHAKWYA